MNTQSQTAPPPPPRAETLAPYLALAALWLLTITLVPPRGNFPLNDDWMYAKVVQHLVDTGHYAANPYVDPTFILQAYWGAAFVQILGFSFETLRISTLVLALPALWAAHWAAREAGLNVRWAFLVALTLMVNPLFLNLSYTFMTDVPFLLVSFVAGGSFLRAFRRDRAGWLAVGVSVCVCGYFVRQFAVVPLIAATVFLIPKPPRARPAQLPHGVLAILLPLLAWILLSASLPIGGLEIGSGWDWDRLGTTWWDRAVEIQRHLAIAFSYLALFAAPLGVAWLARRRSPEPSTPNDAPKTAADRQEAIPGDPARQTPHEGRPIFRATLLAVLATLIAWLIVPRWPHRLPNLGNLLFDLGVGPLLMPGMLDGSTILAPVLLGAGLWWSITALAILGAAALGALHLRAGVRVFARGGFRDPGLRAELFVALWSLGMILVLIMPPVLARFDRYFVMAQIPAAILAARWLAARNPRPASAAYIAAAAMYLLGILCLQDYLAWNTARWKALAALQRDYAAPLDQINGGYEFNGWHHSDRFAEESRRSGRKVFGPLGWWTLEDNYRVSLRAGKQFHVIGSEPYFSWLGLERREMLLLQRTEPDPPQ